MYSVQLVKLLIDCQFAEKLNPSTNIFYYDSAESIASFKEPVQTDTALDVVRCDVPFYKSIL